MGVTDRCVHNTEGPLTCAATQEVDMAAFEALRERHTFSGNVNFWHYDTRSQVGLWHATP